MLRWLCARVDPRLSKPEDFGHLNLISLIVNQERFTADVGLGNIDDLNQKMICLAFVQIMIGFWASLQALKLDKAMITC